MKFFAVLSAVLAVAAASPGYWTIPEVSAAIESSSSDDHLMPYLEAALNELMDQAYAGNPSPTTTISSVVQDFSSWTLNELSEAIQDPATDPALLPYLEYGLNTMMSNIMAGETQEYIIIATPIGVLPIEATVPVVTPEAVVVPAETPAAPAAPAAPASPLVQIIVNIKSQEAAAVAPAPVLVHDPVSVIEKPVPVQPIVPSPVVLPPPPYPSPVVIPSPVIVSPPVVPSPVVLPPPVAPEVVMPNPVDIIAVNPGVSVNPVDILHPVPVVVPIGVGNVVGPMV